MTQKFEYTILDMIESASRVQKTAPLNLGGTGGAGGGVGVPPGGFIGQLPQYRVAYDTVELASSGTLPSGVTGISGWSLVDNLNHIRYRLHELEIASGGSGAIIVQDWDGTPTINPTTKIIFSGASVTDMGGGIALVAVSGGTSGITQAAADARYLKLDASNDPLTAQLDIVPSAAGDGGVYISTTGDSFPLDVEQLTTNTNVTSPAMLILQYTDGTGSYNFNSQLLHGLRYKLGTGTYSSSWIKLEVVGSGTAFEVAHDGKAYSNGSLLVTDAPSDGNAYSRKNAAWVVASGGSALTVQEADGSPIVSNVTNVTFSGATVTDLGGGTALVTISGYTQEEVEDIVGAMVTGNTETGITVTYDDATGKLNFDAQTAGDARYERLTATYQSAAPSTTDVTLVTPSNPGGRNTVYLDLSGLTADRTLYLVGGGAFQTTMEIVVTSGHATYKCYIAPKAAGAGSTKLMGSTNTWDKTLQSTGDAMKLLYLDTTYGWEVTGFHLAQSRMGLPLIVEESDGSPSVNNVDKIIFSGATVTSLGSGDVLVTISGGSTLTVEEADGSPVVTNVDRIVFSGASVTNLGSGDVLVTVSGSKSGHTIQDMGTPLPDRANLNFYGYAVNVTDDAGNNATNVELLDHQIFAHTDSDTFSSSPQEDVSINATCNYYTVTCNTVDVQLGGINASNLVAALFILKVSPSSTTNLILKHQSAGSSYYFNLPKAQNVTLMPGDEALMLTDGFTWEVVSLTTASTLQGVPIDPALKAAATTNDVLTYDGSKLTLSPGGAGGGHTIQDEGTPLTARANLNFVGGAVAVTDDSANNATKVTLTVNESTLSTSDITTGDVSTSKHGFAPKLPNTMYKALRGDGSWGSHADRDGWVQFVDASYAYASASTFTITGDYSATFRKGQRLLWHDSVGWKYGVVLSSTYSSPNTTVTIFTNTDYTLASSMDYLFWSDALQPNGFPTYFNYTPTTTNITLNAGGTLTGKYYVIGSQVFGDYTLTRGASTTFGAQIYIGFPCAVNQNNYFVAGNVSLVDTGTALYTGIHLAETTIRCMNSAGTYAVYSYVSSTAPFTWGNGDIIEGSFRYRY